MKDNTMTSYANLDIMNKILEKHNIKYVAVAGTVLGLNRHGGIIPWDNDIDLGFIYNYIYSYKLSIILIIAITPVDMIGHLVLR